MLRQPYLTTFSNIVQFSMSNFRESHVVVDQPPTYLNTTLTMIGQQMSEILVMQKELHDFQQDIRNIQAQLLESVTNLRNTDKLW